MAAPIAGTQGDIFISGTPDVHIGEIKQWDLEIDREQYDASTLGTTWRVKVPGIGDWKGSLTGFFSISTDAGQSILNNAVLNGAQIYLKLKTQTDTYEGQANPSAVKISNPVDGITTFDVDFEGTGQLFYS